MATTDDAELARLLNGLTIAASSFDWKSPSSSVIDARTALLAYLDREYVRRDSGKLAPYRLEA